MTSSPPAVRIYSGLKELTEDAATMVRRSAMEAVASGLSFSIALSGGRTPLALYRWVADAGPEALPYERILIFWGDERAVPPDHPESNYRMAWDAWLSRAPVDPARVYRMRGEEAPDPAAADYERVLRTVLGDPPVIDLVLLGVGADAHVASLFSGGPELRSERLVVVSRARVSPRRRITLTPRVILSARQILVLVTGSEKADAVRRALEGPPSEAVPASMLRTHQAVWLLDRRAASRLHVPAQQKGTSRPSLNVPQ